MINNIWAGDKIKLRAVEIKDLEFFCNGSIDSNSQRNGDRIIFPVSIEKMKERVEMLSKGDPQGDEYFLIMEDRDGNAVGNINTHSCNKINGTFSYGIGVRNEHRGKGYAKEAIKIVLGCFFNQFRYQKVNVQMYSFNSESIKLHQKLGYIHEGTLRSNIYADGNYHDVHLYGMTKAEFEEKYK